MRRLTIAALVAATAAAALPAPGLAQAPGPEARWQQAQRDYQVATDRYYAERDRYYDTRGGRSYGRGYDAPPPAAGGPGNGDPYYETDYDAARYYRDGPGYRERVLANDDQVYRGSDGRTYCRRGDGTTGLVLGGAAGGILGNVVDGGRRRTAGTLLGAAVGALAGRAVDQNSQQIRCR